MPCGGYENCPLFPAKGKGGLCGGRPGADGLWMNGWTRGTGAVMAPGMRLWRGCLPAGEAVDVFAVVAVEFDEGAEGVVSEVEFVDESGDVFFPCADVGEAGRHADLAQEGAEGVDAGDEIDLIIGQACASIMPDTSDASETPETPESSETLDGQHPQDTAPTTPSRQCTIATQATLIAFSQRADGTTADSASIAMRPEEALTIMSLPDSLPVIATRR